MLRSPLEIHAIEARCEQLEAECQRLREVITGLVGEKVTLQARVKWLQDRLWMEGPRP